MWTRLQYKTKELGKDLSQLESSKDEEVSNRIHWPTLKKKYNIRVKTFDVIIAELKLRIIATAAKVRRYQEKVDRFRQIFQNNERQFYRELNRERERYDDDQTDPEELKKL